MINNDVYPFLPKLRLARGSQSVKVKSSRFITVPFSPGEALGVVNEASRT
jgi:hypothetical protein